MNIVPKEVVIRHPNFDDQNDIQKYLDSFAITIDNVAAPLEEFNKAVKYMNDHPDKIVHSPVYVNKADGTVEILSIDPILRRN